MLMGMSTLGLRLTLPISPIDDKKFIGCATETGHPFAWIYLDDLSGEISQDEQ
jgi:hypothetical protein